MSTTLTREALFEKARPKYEEIDVPGFGRVGIRQRSELKRIQRINEQFDDSGNRVAKHNNLRRLYMLLDQVMVSESEPMFSESDVAELAELDGAKLDPLVAAVTAFNEESEKNEPGGSSDTSES